MPIATRRRRAALWVGAVALVRAAGRRACWGSGCSRGWFDSGERRGHVRGLRADDAPAAARDRRRVAGVRLRRPPHPREPGPRPGARPSTRRGPSTPARCWSSRRSSPTGAPWWAPTPAWPSRSTSRTGRELWRVRPARPGGVVAGALRPARPVHDHPRRRHRPATPRPASRCGAAGVGVAGGVVAARRRRTRPTSGRWAGA